MRFDLVSDVHDDFYRNGTLLSYLERMRNADVLVVAGDVSNERARTADVLNEMTRVYPDVVFVDGNHDHYGQQNVRETETAYFLSRLERNVVYLRPQRPGPVTLDGITFVGLNGWYDFGMSGRVPDVAYRDWKRVMNDRYIAFGSERVDDMGRRHAYVMSETMYSLRDAGTTVVAVTHTIPLARLYEGTRYVGNPDNDFYANTSMSSAIDHGRAAGLRVWCFGHTHDRIDRVVDGVRYVANPRGYPGENPSWTPVTIEVNEDGTERETDGAGVPA